MWILDLRLHRMHTFDFLVINNVLIYLHTLASSLIQGCTLKFLLKWSDCSCAYCFIIMMVAFTWSADTQTDVDVADSIVEKNDKITGSDVKKCTPGVDICGANATCTKMDNDSFACACKSGYFGHTSAACMDKDECTLGLHNCDVHADCTNTAGSFTCACKLGYFGDGINCLFSLRKCTCMNLHVCVYALACCTLF